MRNFTHPLERLIQTIFFKGVAFEVVERPDVIWVGCVDYADNNSDESDISATLQRFQHLVELVPIREKVVPDWSAALSIHYTCQDRPCGMMFANESYTDCQDCRYDQFIQPGGLWLRVRNDCHAAALLLNKKSAEPWEYFAGADAPMQNAAEENGYAPHPNVHLQIEYHCHAEYANPPHTNYAYIPLCRR